MVDYKKEYRFPEGFCWGTATASYQIEGAVEEDGRGESIWDRFCQMPGNVLYSDTGAEADDHYHKWREDLELIKKMGLTAYRFSIAWPRIQPDGRGKANEKGLQFYENIIDSLLEAGIEPFVTIFHWDLPQKLQDMGGWANPEIVNYYEEYCRILLDRFGGKVKHWITMNEAYCISFLGYFEGSHAPGIRDLGTALSASYHVLLAHGRAVRLFRQMGLEGEIGITHVAQPMEPFDPSSEKDSLAASYYDGFTNRWFYDPVLKGNFPEDMIQLFKNRGITLPEFRKDDLDLMSQKIDFVGINYYCKRYICFHEKSWPFYGDEPYTGMAVTARDWKITPEGLTEFLIRLKDEYGVEKVYITENGAAYNDNLTMEGPVEDNQRIDYLKRHIIAAHNAIESGVNLSGYFIWTLIDDFEWEFGRASRFGLVYNDYSTQSRTVKKSGWWYSRVIADNGLCSEE